eukprot:1710673-Rhodomonas_salina.2
MAVASFNRSKGRERGLEYDVAEHHRGHRLEHHHHRAVCVSTANRTARAQLDEASRISVPDIV